MPEPIDHEAVRQAARRRAVQMGLRPRPDPEAERENRVRLPTLNFGALQALLNRGHLSKAQAAEARRLFADAREAGNTVPSETPGDAA